MRKNLEHMCLGYVCVYPYVHILLAVFVKLYFYTVNGSNWVKPGLLGRWQMWGGRGHG